MLYSLIVQNIANRDCVEMLKKENVQCISDYKWQQQLKMYYVNETFVVKVFHMEIPYGYEFLKVYERQPMTPATDKARIKLIKQLN
jgi:hypothetical protein